MNNMTKTRLWDRRSVVLLFAVAFALPSFSETGTEAWLQYAAIDARAKRTPRPIYWADLMRQEATPIFDGAFLRPGNRIAGPAVVETTATTVVVHPGRSLAVDGFGNFEITF